MAAASLRENPSTAERKRDNMLLSEVGWRFG
jgi:hypothetical protein